MASEKAVVVYGTRDGVLEIFGPVLRMLAIQPCDFLKLFTQTPRENGIWIFEGFAEVHPTNPDICPMFVGTWRRPTDDEAIKLAAGELLWPTATR